MSQFPWEEYRQKKDPSDPPQGSAASDPAAAAPPKEEAPADGYGRICGCVF